MAKDRAARATPLQLQETLKTMHTDPLAYFITWTCYGTWLPGDDRGWVKWHKGQKIPQPLLMDWCREQLMEQAVFLNECQRQIVNKTIADHCSLRKWTLHAVNCRTNHCHVVVTALDYDGEKVRDQLKAWCTRKLREFDSSRTGDAEWIRKHCWTRKGSVRKLFDDESVEAAIHYAMEDQDAGGSKCG